MEKKAKLEALNSQYDSLFASLLAVTENQSEPLLFSALAGEAIIKKLNDDTKTYLLTVRLVQNAAAGAKLSSIWTSEKLLTWATATVDYSVTDKTGAIFSSGVVGQSGTKNITDFK